MLSRLWLQDLVIACSRQKKTLETVQREVSMMLAKVVFVTSAKNKTLLTEKNSNRLAFCSHKARHLELEKRLCDYVDNKRQYRCGY